MEDSDDECWGHWKVVDFDGAAEEERFSVGDEVVIQKFDNSPNGKASVVVGETADGRFNIRFSMGETAVEKTLEGFVLKCVRPKTLSWRHQPSRRR